MIDYGHLERIEKQIEKICAAVAEVPDDEEVAVGVWYKNIYSYNGDGSVNSLIGCRGCILSAAYAHHLEIPTKTAGMAFEEEEETLFVLQSAFEVEALDEVEILVDRAINDFDTHFCDEDFILGKRAKEFMILSLREHTQSHINQVKNSPHEKIRRIITNVTHKPKEPEAG